MLQPHLQPFIGNEMQIFQQDNVPCHKSGMTLGWLQDQGI
uniref:Tc1-like transposase DDE domain-containing protein n=1 Tax=Globisporangium ultimum (strain ATCC 200006 / CBS 805.95 / DAOM BR144) TaxID=431595 RepID=K3WSR3_GLOUD